MALAELELGPQAVSCYCFPFGVDSYSVHLVG